MSSAHCAISVEQARVLVIEDKVDNLAAIQRLLAYSGFNLDNCFCKTLGAGALQFAEYLDRVDLVLLDLVFPGSIDGYDVLYELRHHPLFKNTRIIAVTGRAEEMAHARVAGFDGFIAKPLQLTHFPRQIKQILAGEEVWECK